MTLSIRLLRRDDLLYLNFDLVNLQLNKDDAGNYLTRIDPQQPAYLIVYFQPQSIAEEAFVEVEKKPSPPFDPLHPPSTSPPAPPDPPPADDPRVPPIQARIAGRSRLVFRIPDGLERLDYSVASLLDWAKYEICLAPIALPPNPHPEDLHPRPTIAEPTTLQTAIEFPYRLILSPNRTAGWAHTTSAITHNGRSELWHSRLGVNKNGEVDETDESTRTLRAIWSPDYDPASPPEFGEVVEFRTSLSPNNRHQLVRLTSDYGIVVGWQGLPLFQRPNIDININVPGIVSGLNVTPSGRNPVINVGTGIGLDAYGRAIQPSFQIPEITQEIIHKIRHQDIAELSPAVVNAIIGRLVEIDDALRNILIRRARFYNPVPIEAKQFMLTSQGAWARLHGLWDTQVLPIPVREDLGLSLVEWEHQATQGRDHYVRTVDLGYIFPTRHLAVKITITERKFEKPLGGPSVAAYLRQRSFIVLLQPEITYDTGEFQHGGREMPFRQLIRFVTRITPKLDIPKDIGVPGSGAHWIEVAGAPFRFNMQAKDAEGHVFDFTSAAIFVPLAVFGSQNKDTILNSLPGAYKSYTVDGQPVRRNLVPGRRVSFAAHNPSKDGNTELETDAFLLDVRKLNVNVGLPYVPFLETADVRIPAADQVAGGQGSQTIKLYQQYLNSPNGLLDEASNQGQVFGELITQKAIKFTAEQAGGLTTPNLNMSGLSQHLGPVAGTLSNVASGSFVPSDFFPAAMDAKLLGGIDLLNIISAVAGAGFSDQMPQLVSKLIPAPPQIPERMETTMHWTPKVQAFAPLVVHPGTTLTIDVLLTQHFTEQPTPPSAQLHGSLVDFEIDFAEIIRIGFNELTFSKVDNKKLDVHVDIPSDGVKFEGPLAFLNELEKYLDPQSFLDPPVLSISPTGVVVGYTLALPPLTVGVFALQNIALGAILSLPFGGGIEDRMRVRFNLSERHDPFRLTVLIFAGGGFFAVSLGADGMEILEVALEFGASFELDIGVASGGVSAMAGIYFRLEVSPYRLELDAYLRINGHVSVLGLITISIEFYLELSYKELDVGGVTKSKLVGRATVTVKVEVLFFSTSVSMTVERKFSGSADDPTFSDMLTAGDWLEYGEAFA